MSGNELSALSGLIGGVVVAVVNHLLTKKKATAEIEKLRAEAEHLRAQTQQMTKEVTDKVTTLSDKVGYESSDVSNVNETVLYDSAHSDNFDFRVAKVDKAEGELEVKDGILNINRTNTIGTMQISLESYKYGDGGRRRILPKNEKISGERRLHASCEAKAVGSEHSILFILKGEGTPPGVHMAEKKQRIVSNEWTPIHAYFSVSPGQDCHFRIDDRSVSAPGSIQLRNLVLAERTT